MKKLLLVGLGLGLGLAFGPAQAADMPVKAPAAAIVPAINWTGFYVGAQGGYSWDGLEVYTNGPSQGVERSGGFGGVVAGYNYQINKLVLGVQGEYNFSSIQGSASNHYGLQNFTIDSKVKSFGSIDGRIGFIPFLFNNTIFDRFLVYGIGGFAFGDLEHTITLTGVEQDNFSGFQTGYDYGAGVEYAVQKNWSVRAEYRHYDFGHKDFGAVGFLGPHNTNETLSTVRVGVVYLFGG